jgi:molybdopterin-biosynthesis enzyme MoeA-like protein
VPLVAAGGPGAPGPAAGPPVYILPGIPRLFQQMARGARSRSLSASTRLPPPPPSPPPPPLQR